MLERLWRYLKFALVAGLGAFIFALPAQLAASRVSSGEPELQYNCAETVFVIALDKSGSMSGNNDENIDKLSPVKLAVANLVEVASTHACQPQMQFGLITFNDTATLDLNPTSDLAVFSSVLAEVKGGGGTKIEDGVNTAAQVLRRPDFAGWSKVLFLLTDVENDNGSGDAFQQSLRNARDAGIDVWAVVTKGVDVIDVDTLNTELGPERVTQVENLSIGDTFFEQASEIVERTYSIILGDQGSAPLTNLLLAALWTGLVTAGIALALLLFLNRYQKRNRILSRREFLAVLVAFGLGFAVGAVIQYVFNIGVISAISDVDSGFFRRHLEVFLVWTVIGLLLSLGLAGLRVLPNLKLGYAAGFGLLGGLVAGLARAGVDELYSGPGAAVLSALIGAVVLGLAIGFALGLLSDAGTQFPLWLRVFYTSDKVYRYHPLGSTPITLGSGREADIYLQGDHPVMWKFWIDGGMVKIHNFVSDKVRSLTFNELARRGAIELKGLTLKIVDDLGPEKGRSS